MLNDPAPSRADVSPTEALRRTQQSLDETQALSLLGSWEWDVVSGSLSWSAQTFRNFGLEPGSIAPTFEDYLSRLHAADRELVTTTVQTAVISGQPFNYYHRLVRPDGEVRTLHARGGIVKDAAGGSPRMVGTGQDVTEVLKLQAERASLAAAAEKNLQLQELLEEQQTMNETLSAQTIEMEMAQESLREAAHELEESNRELIHAEARYKFLSDAIPVQVWTALPDGNLDYVSRGAEAFFGRPAEKLLGTGWLELVHPDDLPATGAAWAHSLSTGDPYEIEFRILSADNEYTWHLVRAMPLRDGDGNIIKWFGSNTNIDAQRRISEERERLKHEAQAANKAKMEFLAAMSHELRTPLNAINGYTELLLMEIPGPLARDQRDFIARIQRSGKFLLGLINDVLSFAKIDAGALEVRRVDVNIGEVLDGIHTLVEPQIKAKNQLYSYQGPGEGCIVPGDREKIEQVVLNLLTNASKYTKEGGTIELTCSSADGIVRIAVKDSGRGIEMDKLETIFDPFVQVDRNANELSQQGVGLGLAISRELARAMGGDLTVESTPSVGSTFTFSLRTK